MSDAGGDARAQRRERARRARRAATATPEAPLNTAEEVHLPVLAPDQEEVSAGSDTRLSVAGEAQLRPKRRGRVKLTTIQEEPDDIRDHERNYLLRVVVSRMILLGAILAFGWALWEAAQIGIKIYLRNL